MPTAPLPQGAARAGDPEPPPLEPDPDPAGVFYEVKPGDTLWEIARAHNLPVDELAEVNGLESPELLAVGQRIFIPEPDGLAMPHAPTEPRRLPGPRSGEAAGTLAWPLPSGDGEGVIVKDFAPNADVPLDGIVLAAPRGTDVLAADAGEVLFLGDEGTALGRMVILRHEGGLLTIYAHLDEVTVRRGDRVARGAPIGRLGTTGRTESPQLHFQVRRGRTPEDPLDHLPPP